MIARSVAAAVLAAAGVGLATSPEIGGLVTVGFVLFVAGAVFAASVIADLVEPSNPHTPTRPRRPQ